ncbi:hypothetical protein KY308_00110, partial [Candidatus Woesearchaeota archaeon]|nr:hypothetical protein [Candidatus Woesearchaeota archaeon]
TIEEETKITAKKERKKSKNIFARIYSAIAGLFKKKKAAPKAERVLRLHASEFYKQIEHLRAEEKKIGKAVKKDYKKAGKWFAKTLFAISAFIAGLFKRKKKVHVKAEHIQKVPTVALHRALEQARVQEKEIKAAAKIKHKARKSILKIIFESLGKFFTVIVKGIAMPFVIVARAAKRKEKRFVKSLRHDYAVTKETFSSGIESVAKAEHRYEKAIVKDYKKTKSWLALVIEAIGAFFAGIFARKPKKKEVYHKVHAAPHTVGRIEHAVELIKKHLHKFVDEIKDRINALGAGISHIALPDLNKIVEEIRQKLNSITTTYIPVEKVHEMLDSAKEASIKETHKLLDGLRHLAKQNAKEIHNVISKIKEIGAATTHKTVEEVKKKTKHASTKHVHTPYLHNVLEQAKHKAEEINKHQIHDLIEKLKLEYKHIPQFAKTLEHIEHKSLKILSAQTHKLLEGLKHETRLLSKSLAHLHKVLDDIKTRAAEASAGAMHVTAMEFHRILDEIKQKAEQMHAPHVHKVVEEVRRKTRQSGRKAEHIHVPELHRILENIKEKITKEIHDIIERTKIRHVHMPHVHESLEHLKKAATKHIHGIVEELKERTGKAAHISIAEFNSILESVRAKSSKQIHVMLKEIKVHEKQYASIVKQDYKIAKKKITKAYSALIKRIVGVVLLVAAVLLLHHFDLINFTGMAVSFADAASGISVIIGKLIFVALAMIATYHLTKYVVSVSGRTAKPKVPAVKFTKTFEQRGIRLDEGTIESAVQVSEVKERPVKKPDVKKIAGLDMKRKKMINELKEVYKK